MPRIFTDLADPAFSHQGFLGINPGNLHVDDFIIHFHRVGEINPKRQNIAIIDRVHDRIAVEPFSKNLFGGRSQGFQSAGSCGSENRRTGKPKKMVIFKALRIA